MIFYTYMWLREDGTPYYIGKGTRIRAFSQHNIGCAPSKERVLLEPHVTEADALEAEKFLIAYYGRENDGTGILLNRIDGGSGGAGTRRKPVDFGKKISAALRGVPKSERAKEAFRAARSTPEYKAYLSKITKDFWANADNKEKRKASLRGVKHKSRGKMPVAQRRVLDKKRHAQRRGPVGYEQRRFFNEARRAAAK